MTGKRRRAPVSRAVRETCSWFGVGLDDLRPHGPSAGRLAELAGALDATLPPGGVALVTGPSGSGKTRFLRALRARLRAAGRPCHRLVASRPSRARVIDVAARACRRPRPRSIRHEPRPHHAALLARAGLADARLMIARADRLSAGEAWRLDLARAMGRAEGQKWARESLETGVVRTARAAREGVDGEEAVGRVVRHGGSSIGGTVVTLLIDEFTSLLDRATAQVLARLVHRWAKSSRIRVVAATAHDDTLEALGPDAIVVFDGEGRGEIVEKARDA